MPKWRLRFHTLATVFLCILFAGLGLISPRVMFQSERRAAPVLVSLLMTAIALAAINAQFWFRRRILREFSYDGFGPQYRTLGEPRMQSVPLSQLVKVEPWRGRGGQMGYRIV